MSNFLFMNTNIFVKIRKRITTKLILIFTVILCIEIQANPFSVGESDLTFGPETAMQSITVSGIITDETGSPMPGVNVIIKGTATGISTGADGNYSINVPNREAILVFSYIGYITQELTVGNQTVINVVMNENLREIDEIVVVGYGTMRKKDLTGSVISISMENLPATSVTNLTQSLRGYAPGLNISGGSKAGGLPSMSIRGQNTLSASNNPLIVLDGIIFNGSISDINTTDVERIDVLKDASSAAIYGSRSANGVLLITTKAGKNSKPSVAFDASFGVQDYTNNPVKWMNAQEYAYRLVDYNYFQSLYTWYAQRPNGPEDKGGKPIHPGYSDDIVMSFLKTDDERKNYRERNEIDWIDEATRVAPTQNYNVNLSGGADRYNYFASFSHTDQEGVLKGDRFKRTTLNLKVEGNVTNWLKLGVSTQNSYRNSSGMEAEMYAAQNSSPLASKYDETGRYPDRINDEMLMRHPLRYEYIDDTDKRKNLHVTGYAQVKIPFIKNLTYDFNYSNNYSSYNKKTYWPSYTYEGMPVHGETAIEHTEGTYWIFNHIMKYTETFHDIHNFDVTMLYTQDKLSGNSSKINANKFSSEILGYNNVGFAEQYTIGSGAYEQSSLGYMARLNYNLMHKYLFTGTFRRDGFSGFGEKNKLANFFSASLAWNISEENFMDTTDNWLNHLKIRLSYGQNGNQGIGRYSSLSGMTSNSYAFGSSPAIGLMPNTLGNESLCWEITNSNNLGLDFSLFNRRIFGNIDLYIAKTKDVLVRRNLPGATGYTNVWTNIGAVRNRGLEFELNSVNISRPIAWESRFVFSLNRNKLDELYGDGKDDIGNSWFLGKPIGSIYNYERTGGLWTEEDLYSGKILDGFYPGQFKLKDFNGDNKITAADDRTIIGYTEPNYRFGIGNTITYKNFSLYFFINSIQGSNGYYMGDLKRLLEATSDYDYAQRANQPAIRKNWTPDNEVTNAPAIYNYPTISSGNYQSRSFVRLQDLSLSYNLDKKLLSRLNIESMQLYLSGHNLYTWTNWEGFDPELGGFYEMMIRDLSAGLRIKF
jgi:TonB-linked SusC/RagA family outer membrane protein